MRISPGLGTCDGRSEGGDEPAGDGRARVRISALLSEEEHIVRLHSA